MQRGRHLAQIDAERIDALALRVAYVDAIALRMLRSALVCIA